MDAARHQTQSKINECMAKWPDPRKRPITPRERCRLAALRSSMTQFEPHNLDLFETVASNHLRLADQYDRKQLSYESFLAQSEAKRSEVRSIELSRNRSAANARAAQSSALIARGLDTYQRSSSGYPNPYPTSTHCNRTGTMVNCTHH
jgi:hypothetical protein